MTSCFDIFAVVIDFLYYVIVIIVLSHQVKAFMRVAHGERPHRPYVVRNRQAIDERNDVQQCPSDISNTRVREIVLQSWQYPGSGLFNVNASTSVAQPSLRRRKSPVRVLSPSDPIPSIEIAEHYVLPLSLSHTENLPRYDEELGNISDDDDEEDQEEDDGPFSERPDFAPDVSMPFSPTPDSIPHKWEYIIANESNTGCNPILSAGPIETKPVQLRKSTTARRKHKRTWTERESSSPPGYWTDVSNPQSLSPFDENVKSHQFRPPQSLRSSPGPSASQPELTFDEWLFAREQYTPCGVWYRPDEYFSPYYGGSDRLRYLCPWLAEFVPVREAYISPIPIDWNMPKASATPIVEDALDYDEVFDYEEMDDTVKYSPTLFPQWNPFRRGAGAGYDLPHEMESQVEIKRFLRGNRWFDRDVYEERLNRAYWENYRLHEVWELHFVNDDDGFPTGDIRHHNPVSRTIRRKKFEKLPTRRQQQRLHLNRGTAYRVVKGRRSELKQSRRRTPRVAKITQSLSVQLSDGSSSVEEPLCESPAIHHPTPRRRLEVSGLMLLWEGIE